MVSKQSINGSRPKCGICGNYQTKLERNEELIVKVSGA